MIEWIDAWFDKNEPLIESLVASVKGGDKEDFILECPHQAKGWDFAEEEGACFVVTYTTEGSEGGNCWGDESRYFITTERDIPEDGFHEKLIYRLLEESEKVMKISDMAKIQRRIASIVNEKHIDIREYYGNYKTIKAIYVKGDELFDLVKDYY